LDSWGAKRTKTFWGSHRVREKGDKKEGGKVLKERNTGREGNGERAPKVKRTSTSEKGGKARKGKGKKGMISKRKLEKKRGGKQDYQ